MTYRITPIWLYPGARVEVVFENDGSMIEAHSYIPNGFSARVTVTAAAGKDHSRPVGSGHTEINIGNPALQDGDTRVGLDLEPT